MASKKKSAVGSDVILPKTLPKKARSATPSTGTDRGNALRRENK